METPTAETDNPTPRPGQGVPSQRPPDWRWRAAVALAAGHPQDPVPHENEWIGEAVFYLQRSRGKPRVRRTEVQQAIHDAFGLYRRDSITRIVVETSLLAQQPPDLIAQQFNLPERMVAAFAALFFDVQGTTGWSVWDEAGRDGQGKRTFFTGLRDYVHTHSPGALMPVILLLGKCQWTLADHLPDIRSSSWPREFQRRLELALVLLADNRRTLRIRQRAEWILFHAKVAGQLTLDAIGALTEVLAAARVPTSVRKEIEGLLAPHQAEAEQV